MKPRLIIHIGTNKTGTTYLQKTFYENYRKLLDRKILYPKNLSVEYLNEDYKHLKKLEFKKSLNELNMHSHWPTTTFKRIGRDGAKILNNTLLEQLSAHSCSTILLSWEGFYVRNKFNYPELFQECKNDFDITTICFVRRPDYYMESHWAQGSQLLNHLQIAPFLNDRGQYSRLEIINRLMPWRTLGSVIVANYEEGKKSGLLEYFNQKAGIPATVTSEMEIGKIRVNPSILANCASTLARLREMGLSPNVDRVISAFRHDRGSLALGSRLRAKLLADRKDALTTTKREYGLRFSDEMPEEQTDPLEGPSPTSLLLAFAASVSTPPAKGEKEANVV